MLFSSISKHRLFSGLAALGCLLTGLPVATLAQTNSGLTIFSGVENRADILNYRLDFGGQRNQRDRYRLRIPADKIELGVSQIAIAYPDYFTGQFDTDSIVVCHTGSPTQGSGRNQSRNRACRGSGKHKQAAEISEVVWDKDNRVLLISLTNPIQAENAIEIKLSNVRNPFFGGTFYFHGRVLSPGDVPLPRYVGTWIVSIE